MTYNFSPGPAILPKIVREELRSSLLDFKSSGIGIAEISHRSNEFEELINETQVLFKKLTGLDSSYKVLLIAGGANLQFSMLPMNLTRKGKKAAYLLSGVWAEKAYQEARKFTSTIVAGSGKNSAFKKLPVLDAEFFSQESELSYLHYTSNNTIYGTEFHNIPETKATIVCDASSDFLSKELDYSKVKLWYACTQKNLGIAGLTLVAIHESLLDETQYCEADKIPQMLRYKVYADSNSLYNTPPCVAILATNLVLKWIDSHGGLKAMEKLNKQKAELLYSAIDQGQIYIPYADRDSRSLMNITFNLTNADLENLFAKEAEAEGMRFLKGHRDVGGLRISTYNAQTLEACQELRKFIDQFAKKHG